LVTMRGQVVLGHLLLILLAQTLYTTAQTDAPKPDTTTVTGPPASNVTKEPDANVEKLQGPKGTKCVISKTGGNMTVFRDVFITVPDTNKTSNNSTNKTMVSKMSKTMEIGVSFLQLKELNANGSQVIDTNNVSHSFTTFSTLPFKCAPTINSPVMSSPDVIADCLFCWTNFTGLFEKTTFRINACIAKTNGTITQLDESSNVTAGQLKFSVELMNGWQWCDSSCKNGAGEFLDMDIGIKLPKGAEKMLDKIVTKQEKGRPAKFDLGSGAIVDFSKIVSVDGKWAALAQNTPSMAQRDGMNVVTVRFPRFNSFIYYDPTVETGDKAFEAMGANSASRKTLPFPIFIIAALFALANHLMF